MDYSSHGEMDEMAGDIADDIARTLKKGEIVRPTGNSGGFNLHGWLAISCGVLIAVLITVFCLFFACRDEKPREEAASLNARLGELEKRLTPLEAAPERVSLLEQKVKSLQQSVTTLEKSRAARLQAQATKKKAVSTAKKRYHVVRQGEVLFKIARQYGISVNELCRLNNITQKAVIRPGQKLFIGPGSKQ